MNFANFRQYCKFQMNTVYGNNAEKINPPKKKLSNLPQISETIPQMC